MRNNTKKCLFLATAMLFFWGLEAQAKKRKETVALPKQVLQAQKIGKVKLADSLAF